MRSYVTITFFYFLTNVYGKWHFSEADESYSREHDPGPLKWRRALSYQKLRDTLMINRIEKKLINYTDGDQVLTGYVTYDMRSAYKRPLVIVVHDSNGRDEFENGRAEALARFGYVGFALDLYGQKASTQRDKESLMREFVQNRQSLLKRLQLALNEARQISIVNPHKIGAIGYSFGGMGVLDMARAGWDLKGVVSFHGLLSSPQERTQMAQVKTKILLLHGHNDPDVPPSEVLAFEDEMTKRKADWQVHIYSHAANAFTLPACNTTNIKFDTLAEKRSWLAMKKFFDEAFN